MRIVAHLGLMKTGTTTIQSTLRRNAVALRGRVAVVAQDGATALVRRHGQRFFQNGRADAEAPLRDALAGLRATLERDGAPVAIVSDENLYCRQVYSDDGDLFAWTRQALPILAEAFDGHDMTFAFYGREPVAWMQSAWRQMVKRARCTVDFDAWRAALPFDPDWSERFAELREIGGSPIVALDMDAEAAQDRLGVGLFRLAGLTPAEIAAIDWSPARNESLPFGATEFMRRVNASDLPYRMVLRVSDLVEASRDMFVSEGEAVMTRPALQHEELQDG